MSNPLADMDKPDVIFCIGTNMTECHPVAATRIKQALKRGAKSTLGRFKPPTHSDEKQRGHLEDKTDKKRKHYLIFLSHLLFIVPLLVYIAVKGRRTPPKVFVLLGALAGATALYHGYAVINLTH